jgi:hypothetical protein
LHKDGLGWAICFVVLEHSLARNWAAGSIKQTNLDNKNKDKSLEIGYTSFELSNTFRCKIVALRVLFFLTADEMRSTFFNLVARSSFAGAHY